MNASLTRRALLGAAAAVPIVRACSAEPALVATPDAEFDAKVAAWRALEAESTAFNRSIGDPAHDAFFAAGNAWEEACADLPHTTTTATYRTANDKDRAMTTAKSMDIGLAQSFVKKPFEADDFNAVCRELMAAHEAREAEKVRLRSSYNLDELKMRSDEVERQEGEKSDRAYEALCAVLTTPASSVRVVAVKLEIIEEEHLHDIGAFWDDIVADVRRLGGLEVRS